MDSRKEIELDRLVSEMFDEGASAERMQRLESLLLDDPAVQERYWQLVSAHVALGVAVGGSRNSRAHAALDRRQTPLPLRTPRGRLSQGAASTQRRA